MQIEINGVPQKELTELFNYNEKRLQKNIYKLVEENAKLRYCLDDIKKYFKKKADKHSFTSDLYSNQESTVDRIRISTKEDVYIEVYEYICQKEKEGGDK